MQAGGTSALQRAVGRPLMVALVSAFGIVLITGIVAAAMGGLGFAGKAARIPWWAWCSGVFGSAVVISQPVAGPKIGAGAYIAITVTASTVMSVVIDNFAWLDFPRHAASVARIAGVLMMILGVGLVAAF